MKKLEKYIYIVIGLIIGTILASTLTYVIINNTSENNADNKDNITEDNKDNNKETNTLIEELENYLSYIPNDIFKEKESVYRYPNIVSNMSDVTLMGKAIDYAVMNEFINLTYDEETKMNQKDEDIINETIKKLYNKNLKISDYSNIVFEVDCAVYKYNNSYMYCSGGCGEIWSHINKIEKYEINENELIMYEYAAEYNVDFENPNFSIIKDYHNKHEFKTDDNLQNYFNQNKENFTMYKHTFKKNNLGYYWYSTEVAK